MWLFPYMCRMYDADLMKDDKLGTATITLAKAREHGKDHVQVGKHA